MFPEARSVRSIPVLCILLMALPAVAEEDWTFDAPRAVLVWDDGTRLSPEEAGPRRGDWGPAGSAAARSIRVQDLAPNAWRVARHDEATGAELWARELYVDAVPAGSGRRRTYLSAIAWHPSPTHPGSDSYELVGGDLVLSLGGGALIVAVDLPTGLVRWQVAHVAEYVRSQEDPPNYLMHMARVRGRGERSRLLELARVTAGPVVVEWEGSYRVFVGVTEDRERETATPIPESRVYEIDGWGEVISVIRLPRALVMNGAVAMEGGALFSLGGGALVRVEPSYQREGGFRGAGGTDRVGRIAWYVEPASEPPPELLLGGPPGDGPHAWLQSRWVPDGVAVCGPYVVQVRAGARLDKAKNGHWTFPLRRFDARTGQFKDMELRVPARGTVPPPTTNFARTTWPDGAQSFDVFTRHEAWLDAVEEVGGRLAIELHTRRGGEWRWTFAIPGVPQPERDPAARPPMPTNVLPTEDPPLRQEPATLDDATRAGWPEVRVTDPDALVAPLAVPDRERVERLAAIALAGPSSVWRASLRVLGELPEEAASLVPAESLPRLVQLLLAHGTLRIDNPLWERLRREAPEAALLVLASMRMESPSQTTQIDAEAALRSLGDAAREIRFRTWIDRERHRNDTFLWKWLLREKDSLSPEERQATWARLRELLRDADPRARAAAATALSADRDPAARAGTLELAKVMLRSAHIEVRVGGAVLAAAHIADGHEQAVTLAAALGEALQTPHSLVVGECLSALQELGPRARSQVEAVRGVVRRGPRDGRARALGVLAFLAAPDDAETLRLLEEYTESPDAELATAATSALQRLRPR